MGKNVKKPYNLIGSPGSPLAITQGTSANGILPMEGDIDAGIGMNVTWTGSLTTAFTIQFFWSPDETTFFEDRSISPVTGVTGAQPTGGATLGPYHPPDYAKAYKVVVNNLDASVTINVLVMGSSIDYTITQ